MQHSRIAGTSVRSEWSPSPAADAAEVFAWLRRWQGHINSGDIAAGRRLFADDVVAFGSLADMMVGKDELITRQWTRMWPRLKDFNFDFGRLSIIGEPDDPFVVIVTPWQSLGRKGTSGWYDRRGRASLVLKRTAAGLLCVHSHFSMEPGIPPTVD